jgi:hypothetical protein
MEHVAGRGKGWAGGVAHDRLGQLSGLERCS